VTSDVRKQIGPYYTARRDPGVVRVPAFTYLAIAGRGHPAKSSEFKEGIQALYTLAYTLKFSGKPGSRQRAMPVPPLDVLFWVPGRQGIPARAPRSAWRWRAMLMVPGFVTPAMVAKARKAALAKRDLPALRRARLIRWKEGLCGQVLHVGPYSAEGPTIRRLHEFIRRQGYRPTGRHHEVYLSDPNRTSPKNLKTIVRQPMR
jgi:hypothetical protein